MPRHEPLRSGGKYTDRSYHKNPPISRRLVVGRANSNFHPAAMDTIIQENLPYCYRSASHLPKAPSETRWSTLTNSSTIAWRGARGINKDQNRFDSLVYISDRNGTDILRVLQNPYLETLQSPPETELYPIMDNYGMRGAYTDIQSSDTVLRGLKREKSHQGISEESTTPDTTPVPKKNELPRLWTAPSIIKAPEHAAQPARDIDSFRTPVRSGGLMHHGSRSSPSVAPDDQVSPSSPFGYGPLLESGSSTTIARLPVALTSSGINSLQRAASSIFKWRAYEAQEQEQAMTAHQREIDAILRSPVSPCTPAYDGETDMERKSKAEDQSNAEWANFERRPKLAKVTGAGSISTEKDRSKSNYEPENIPFYFDVDGPTRVYHMAKTNVGGKNRLAPVLKHQTSQMSTSLYSRFPSVPADNSPNDRHNSFRPQTEAVTNEGEAILYATHPNPLASHHPLEFSRDFISDIHDSHSHLDISSRSTFLIPVPPGSCDQETLSCPSQGEVTVGRGDRSADALPLHTEEEADFWLEEPIQNTITVAPTPYNSDHEEMASQDADNEGHRIPSPFLMPQRPRSYEYTSAAHNDQNPSCAPSGSIPVFGAPGLAHRRSNALSLGVASNTSDTSLTTASESPTLHQASTVTFTRLRPANLERANQPGQSAADMIWHAEVPGPATIDLDQCPLSLITEEHPEYREGVKLLQKQLLEEGGEALGIEPRKERVIEFLGQQRAARDEEFLKKQGAEYSAKLAKLLEAVRHMKSREAEEAAKLAAAREESLGDDSDEWAGLKSFFESDSEDSEA